MTARAHIAPDTAPAVRPSAKVARVCEILECEQSQVRRLLADGEIEGHTIGRRGVRIYLDSVAAYQDRKSRIAAAPRGRLVRARRAVTSAAHSAAMARLRAGGYLQ